MLGGFLKKVSAVGMGVLALFGSSSDTKYECSICRREVSDVYSCGTLDLCSTCDASLEQYERCIYCGKYNYIYDMQPADDCAGIVAYLCEGCAEEYSSICYVCGDKIADIIAAYVDGFKCCPSCSQIADSIGLDEAHARYVAGEDISDLVVDSRSLPDGFELEIVDAAPTPATDWEERKKQLVAPNPYANAKISTPTPTPTPTNTPTPTPTPKPTATPKPVQLAKVSQTVYITKTGSKYHRSGCSYLKSSIPIEKSTAIASGYEPCSRCNP